VVLVGLLAEDCLSMGSGREGVGGRGGGDEGWGEGCLGGGGEG
jgi:hypothetical protein